MTAFLSDMWATIKVLMKQAALRRVERQRIKLSALKDTITVELKRLRVEYEQRKAELEVHASGQAPAQTLTPAPVLAQSASR